MWKSLGGTDRRQLAVKIDILFLSAEIIRCFILAFSRYGIGFCAFILNMKRNLEMHFLIFFFRYGVKIHCCISWNRSMFHSCFFTLRLRLL